MAGTNWASAEACRKRRCTPRYQQLAVLLALALLWDHASARITFYLSYNGQERRALDCVAAAGASVTYNIRQDNVILGTCPDASCYQKVARCGSILDTTGVVVRRPNTTASGEAMGMTAPAGSAAMGGPIPDLQPEAALARCVQWGPDAIGAPAAWAAGVTGAGVRVAILDEPMHCYHQDIGRGDYAHLVDIEAGAIFVECDRCVGATPCQRPDAAVFSHGTHVAGITAARGVGTVGVAPRSTIIPIAVLGLNGEGTWESLIAGIYHAVTTAKADILNLSLGGLFTAADRKEVGSAFAKELWAPMVRAVNFAHRQGALVVVSAGNDALDLGTLGSGRDFLSSLPNTISVSATGPPGTWCPGTTCIFPAEAFECANLGTTPLPEPASDMRVPAFIYTNYGNKVDLAAPGGNPQGRPGPLYDWLTTMILAPSQGTFEYTWAAGTSMAAPHVAGAAALVLSKYPNLKGKPAQIKARLMQGAAGDPQYAAYYGKGFLQVPASLA
jgi:subtilisin family serine protease